MSCGRSRPDIDLPSNAAGGIGQQRADDGGHVGAAGSRDEIPGSVGRQMHPLTLMRRPTFAHTSTFGAGGTYTGGGGGGGGGGAPGGGGAAGGGGGGGSASLRYESGSAHPVTSTCLPPIDPHSVAPADGALTVTRPPTNSAAATHVPILRTSPPSEIRPAIVAASIVAAAGPVRGRTDTV